MKRRGSLNPNQEQLTATFTQDARAAHPRWPCLDGSAFSVDVSDVPFRQA